MSLISTIWGASLHHKSTVIARNTKATARNTAAIAGEVQSAALADRQRWDYEQRFRYDTDPAYRAWVDQQVAAQAAHRQRMIAAGEATRRRQKIRTVQVVTLPLLAVTIALCAAVVWAPQMLVQRATRRPLRRWHSDDLRGLWSRTTQLV